MLGKTLIFLIMFFSSFLIVQGFFQVSQKENNALIDHVNQLLQEKEKLSQNVAAIFEEKKFLEQEIDTINSEKDTLEEEINRLTQEVDEKNILAEKIKEITIERNNLQNKIIEIIQKKEQLKKSIDALVQEKEYLTIELDRVIQEKAPIEQEVTRMLQERNTLQAQLHQTAQEKAIMQEKIIQLTEEKTTFESQVTSLSREKEKLREQVLSLAKEKEALKKKVTDMEQALQKKQTEEKIEQAKMIPPAIKKTPDKPVNIVVMGDSLADGIWSSLYNKFIKRSDIKVIRHTKVSSGICVHHFHDWVGDTKDLFQQQSIDILVILLGTNDKQAFYYPDRSYIYYSKEQDWTNAYQQRAKEIVDIVENNHVYAMWIGLPGMRSSKMYNHALRVNQIYQTITNHSSIDYISTWELTVDENNKYQAYRKDSNNRNRLIRANDGVHFTGAGYNMISEQIYQKILIILGENSVSL